MTCKVCDENIHYDKATEEWVLIVETSNWSERADDFERTEIAINFCYHCGKDYRGLKSGLREDVEREIETGVYTIPLKTVAQWEKHLDVVVLNADGFPPYTDRNTTLFTEKEFLEYCSQSTVKFNSKLQNK